MSIQSASRYRSNVPSTPCLKAKRCDLFGSLPDTIKDEWLEDIETLDERLDEYINAQKTAMGFDLRYTGTMMPPEKDWREFTEVLSTMIRCRRRRGIWRAWTELLASQPQ